MAVKKTELYSSLWKSCDELRGGMDASQYKDYVLTLLFVKYISDKYAGEAYAPITIPEGASFADMVKLKGNPEIGDLINKKILTPIWEANRLGPITDFNDTGKLGSGKAMVDTLTELISIFENPRLEFSKNRADDDDILGDAYEYLMRHFATESGKSKGQFYTPAEVSRIIAQVLGIREDKTTNATTAYDPTCGSGSLLLKVAAEARTKLSLYGQEKDEATWRMARMNMILHGNAEADLQHENTLAKPKFKDGDRLKTFDYVVANPPFSDKAWVKGLTLPHDEFERFQHYGVPPAKNGDYAYLLHIVRSLKETGKGACILPHGVLFRGNAEADIRRNLVKQGIIKGIIGLPANLFYGTGIPACIIILDKQHATARNGIFMIDASKEGNFEKEGPKNRLRARDIHKIVDAFRKQSDIPKYARMVPVKEIESNDYNLNLPLYINSQEEEDLQDIEGHLKGGIPERDVNALQSYWDLCPKLRKALFKANRPGYLDLAVEVTAIKATINEHPEFVAFRTDLNKHFAAWRETQTPKLKALETGIHPKDEIHKLSEGLLAHFQGKLLINAYAVYQHLMDYWATAMQDDVYAITVDGWKAETCRVIEKITSGKKKGQEKDVGWTCDLIPKPLLVARFYAKEQAALDQLHAEFDAVAAQLTELEEEHSGDEGILGTMDPVNKANVNARLKEIKGDRDAADERAVLESWSKLNEHQAELKAKIKKADADLDEKAHDHYPKLTDAQIKEIVVHDKWLAALEAAVQTEMARVNQNLTSRVKELAVRYTVTLPQIRLQVAALETKVNEHLARMGFVW